MLSFLAASACVFLTLRYVLMRALESRLAQLGWPSLSHVNLLTLSYKRDEAATYLAVVNTLSDRIATWIWRLLGLGAMLLLVLLTVTVALPLIFGGLDKVPETRRVAIIANSGRFQVTEGLVFLFILAILLVPVAYLLPLLRGNPYAYGWERPSSNILLDIDATYEPIGLKTASAEHFHTTVGDFAKGKGMAHTLIYEDPVMLQKLVDWISRNAR